MRTEPLSRGARVSRWWGSHDGSTGSVGAHLVVRELRSPKVTRITEHYRLTRDPRLTLDVPVPADVAVPVLEGWLGDLPGGLAGEPTIVAEVRALLGERWDDLRARLELVS